MKAFFDAIRAAFGGSLTQEQVDGMTVLLRHGVGLPRHHMANILANVRHETGGGMMPIKETVMPSHKNSNPSDAEVISRLDRAWKGGKLKWVKEPYWRDGWFGRGQLQVTHRRNYQKFGISNPADMLDPEVSAKAAIRGMVEGLFTGKKLADYHFPAALDEPPERNPRRIVNGKDGTDQKVAAYHLQFARALLAANWGIEGHPLQTKPVDGSGRPTGDMKPPLSAPRATLAHMIVAALRALGAAIVVLFKMRKTK